MYYNKTKQKKKFLIISLLILFVISFNILNKKEEVSELSNLCFVLTATDKLCLDKEVFLYDEYTDIYYVPVDEKYLDENVYFDLLNNTQNYSYYINDDRIFDAKIKFNYADTINFRVNNEKKELLNVNLKFTRLPIVNLNINGRVNDNDQKAFFNVIGPYGSPNQDLYTKKILIRYRGNTSRAFDKKAYKVEFKKSDEDIITFDNSVFKENEDWALDALYTDPSKIRNKLGMDIWNFINQVDQEKDNINTEFIELYINNDYQGLYTMKNIVNREKLQLNKTSNNNSSILIKGMNYIPIDWNKTSFNNIDTKMYKSLEMKYPNKQIYYETYWSVILSKLANFYKDDINNYDNIEKTFYLNNFLDYKIFVELTAATDNYNIKNAYYSMENKNSNIMITPWDLDLTFGIHFTEEDRDFFSVKNADLVNYLIDGDAFTGDEKYLKVLKDRYQHLKNQGLTKEFVHNLIDEYVEDIYYSSLKDSTKWYEYDILSETKEIKEWVSKRFDFLDKKIKEL